MLVGFLLPVWCICMRSLDRQESSALRGQSLLWLGSGAELQLLASAAFIPGRLLPVCLVAAACGLQNAMCTSHFGAIIRTTHVSCLLYTSSCSESPVARWQRSYVFRYEVAQMFNWAVAIARCLVARKFKKTRKAKKRRKNHKIEKKRKRTDIKKEKNRTRRDGCRKSHEAKKSREAISHRV